MAELTKHEPDLEDYGDRETLTFDSKVTWHEDRPVKMTTVYEYNSDLAVIEITDGDTRAFLTLDTGYPKVIEEIDAAIALLTRLRDKIKDAEGGWWRLSEEKKNDG